MKYIEKCLTSKGYQVDSAVGEIKENSCWCKTDTEKVIVPRKDVLQSSDLPGILLDKNLLMEFRKF